MSRSYKLSELGKNFLVEPSGTQLTDEEIELLSRLQPKALMFRTRNFLVGADYKVWLDAYKRLLSQCRQILPYERLMIAIDYEGGRVIRPPSPITRFPYAGQWASSVAAVAEAMAEELKSIGVNVNFAPVADINSNPENPVINERAFGSTAKYVSKAALEFARALQDNGVAPCAKHFPGHGDTKIDSHYGAPILDLTLDELRRRELLPFQALIDAGVLMVMTAHILFPKIDPQYNATMSRKLLNDLLREEMGFKGVVIADALGMAAAADKMTSSETVAQAVNAGLDIFLTAGDNVTIIDAVNMAEHLRQALEKGEVSESTLTKSQERIDNLIDNLPQHSVVELNAEIFARHQALSDRLAAPASTFNLSLPGFE